MFLLPRILLVFLIGFMFMGAVTKPSNAALVATSDSTFSLGQIHQDDSAGGLYWLDLSFSLNQSYNTIASRIGTSTDTLYGWRYANLTEITSLFSSLGITGSITAGGNAGAVEIQAALGSYFSDTILGTRNIGAGMIDLVSTLGRHDLAFTYDYFTTAPAKGAYSISELAFLNSAAFADYGSYLVRNTLVTSTTPPPGGLTDQVSTVPLPPAAILFGTGLFGLGAIKRRKSQKA